MKKLVNLENHINYYPKELSGSQRKRVSIARTLSLNPEV
ncbi:MAG TPA: ATP-binding cassette domain-containing protein, partial [Aquificae bacterium]|nr:ATP-binding cassette domain-containing protein [Aquificota bacterium]